MSAPKATPVPTKRKNYYKPRHCPDHSNEIVIISFRSVMVLVPVPELEYKGFDCSLHEDAVACIRTSGLRRLGQKPPEECTECVIAELEATGFLRCKKDNKQDARWIRQYCRRGDIPCFAKKPSKQ